MNIMVLGCSGGGKSTTAAKLAEIFDLKPIHLDLFLWKSGWVQRGQDEMAILLKQEFANDGWVSDGNHRAWGYDERVARADMLVWVDMPRWRCMFNIFYRVWKYRGKSRPSMTEGCPDRLNWEFTVYVWNFKYNRGRKLAELFKRLNGQKRLYQLRTYKELNEFLKNMQKESDLQRQTT